MMTRHAQLMISLGQHDRSQVHLTTLIEMIQQISDQADVLAAQEAMIKELSEEVKLLKKKLERASRLDGKGHAV